MEKQRNEVVDICRGIAAVLMILGHSFITYPVNVLNEQWCSVLEHFIYSFHMEMFFVLAGVVYKCKDYKVYIKNKVFRILIPYVFFCVLTALFKAYGGDAVNGGESFGTGMKNMLLYGGSYWFLYVLFIIFVFYPLFERVTKSNIFAQCGLIVICIAARFLVPTMCPFRFDYLVKFIPYFMVGTLIKEKVQENWRPKYRMPTYLGCILVYILTDWMMSKYSITRPIDYIRALSIILLLIWLLTEVVRKGDAPIKLTQCVRLFLCKCGQFSLQLYLFNGFIMTAIRIVVCSLAGIRNSFLIVASIWIGNLVITLLLCEFFIPRIPVVRTLCGMRGRKNRPAEEGGTR